ncbi:DUF3422 domain-containing protein [Tsuneonella mangrovi]|uniref:DUF3422 domain-containing protein n=1 Tax=Tsuneonella mangrovi TaxID=1982042 RepID=UPI000BA25E40|nr:DUF3422 domain-containing protein [Tsuneonella mangrovi]
MALREHELRRQIVGEMHLRRWPEVVAPATIYQIVRIVSESEREQEREVVEQLFDQPGDALRQDQRHLSGVLATGLRADWERHTEGSTITLFAAPDNDDEQISNALCEIESLPGKVIRATRIVVAEDEGAATESIAKMGFVPLEVVSSHVGPGVRFWSDFRIHAHGYGGIVVAANGCPPPALGRTIQQLQELGNYRNMALLGLPPTRDQWPRLDIVERELRRFAANVSDPAMKDDALLEYVAALSLDIANLSNAIGYRLDATRAYAQLVSERLDELGPVPIAGFQSIAEFTQRRLQPGVRTCEAHRNRLAQLSDRARDLTALLRARVETRIENQNARLLESMNQTGQRQMRLQQLVEGLSIFALTYYGVGLLGYLLGGLEEVTHVSSPGLIKAAAVPILIVTIAMAFHAIRRRILDD